MSEHDLEALPAAATIEITSRDLAAGAAALEADIAAHACSGCGAQFADRYHFDCPECGQVGSLSSRCRSCSGSLLAERVYYVAYGPRGGTASKILPGVTCLTCGVSGVEHHWLAKLDELAAMLGTSLHFLPEAGIYTPAMLEVLADADVSAPGAPDEVAKQGNGMSVRVGSPSALFDAALEVVIEREPGNVFSPTLQVTPGPPYGAAQRREFHVLLGQIQRDLGAPVVCWSASVGLSDDPPIDAVLTEQLTSWEADAHGSVLALYHDIVADRAPGRLRNSVRFLELVLERQRVERIARARRDARVTDADFRALVEGFSLDLGAQLRQSIRSLPERPLDILQRLWLTMRPGKSFDEGEVYDAIVSFPESHAHKRDGQGPRLPWEEPDFDGYARELQKLVSAMLDNSLDNSIG
jgi:predicted RNA-binding Zn-ribbon protein involved in translation (DUF1610 family)